MEAKCDALSGQYFSAPESHMALKYDWEKPYYNTLY